MEVIHRFLIKIILSGLFCACFIVNVLTAQDYKPFIEPNKYWDVIETGPLDICIPTYISYDRYFFLGDTTINDLTYSKLAFHTMMDFPDAPPFCVLLGFSRDTFHVNHFFIREDTAAQQVYRYDTHDRLGNELGEESLIYDFSLKVGDLLPAECGGSEDYLIISSIDVEVDKYGIERKVYKTDFEYIGNCVEGLGLGSVFFPSCNSIEGGSSYCYYYDSTQGPNPCFDFITSTENIVQSDISIYPNPVRDVLNLTNVNDGATVDFYNLTGALIHSFTVSSATINTSILPAGMLMLSIRNEDGQVVYLDKVLKID